MLAPQIEDFPKLWPSKRPSKSCFASIFYRFWLRLGLQLGANLGAKTAQNRKNGSEKMVPVLSKSGSGYEPAFQDRSRAFWPRFLGGQGSIFDDFCVIFGTSSLTLGMFSPALSCLGFRCSWLGLQPTLPRKSKNLPRTKPRIQEPAEDKAEKKIRTNAFRKTQISKLSSSKLPSLSQGSRLRKLWAAVLPPGGLQLNNLHKFYGFQLLLLGIEEL